MQGQASAPWSSGTGCHRNVPLSEWQVAQTPNCLKQQNRDMVLESENKLRFSLWGWQVSWQSGKSQPDPQPGVLLCSHCHTAPSQPQGHRARAPLKTGRPFHRVLHGVGALEEPVPTRTASCSHVWDTAAPGLLQHLVQLFSSLHTGYGSAKNLIFPLLLVAVAQTSWERSLLLPIDSKSSGCRALSPQSLPMGPIPLDCNSTVTLGFLRGKQTKNLWAAPRSEWFWYLFHRMSRR